MNAVRNWRYAVGAAITAVLTAGLFASAPAGAVGGDVPSGAAYGFLAKVTVGEPGVGQSCTGALVGARWVVTAKSCFGASVVAGPPAVKTKVTVGRLDLSDASAGYVVPALKVLPHPDRDVALVQLAATVTGVRPIPVSAQAPAVGEVVSVLGFGRTAGDWVPSSPRMASFTVSAVDGALTAVAGTTDTQVGPCRGDAGGPGVRTVNGALELAAITHSGGQGGCLGAPADAARGGTQTRLDDIAGWVRQNTAEVTVQTLKSQNSGLCLALPSNWTALPAIAIQWSCSGAADQDWQLNQRANGEYEIRNDRSGHCLALEGGATKDGTPVVQWTCRDNVDQYWQLTKDANGYTELRNSFSGKCLAVQGGDVAMKNGAQALIWPCRESNLDQNWTITARTPGGWVRSAHSSLCMSNGVSLADGAHAVQAACSDLNDMEWTLRTRKDDLVEVRNDRSGQCLAIEGGVTTAGTHLLQWPCRDNVDQYWRVEATTQGTVVLHNNHSRMCLAIQGGVKTDAHLLQWNCNGNADQYWTVGRKA
ncbi:ricin-type beta-trefoil lectin domain protein [Actinoplanes sp. CA-252034]|uniref:ricin-type beta-trefoil lectin domain protein n=1 Tax=Actinoplanes sp. CA-252034 TaxID=3239906 RepID=UPI003D961B01